VAAPTRLGGALAEVPAWPELGVDATLGAWRGFSGPPRLLPAQVAWWREALHAATQTPQWKQDAQAFLWAPTWYAGAELERYLADEPTLLRAVLTDLALIQSSSPQ
jgi:putative tricarboxylic transport membrane protein